MKAKKMKSEVTTVKSMGSYYNVGPTYINVILQLYESCIVPSVLYNMEVWNQTELKKTGEDSRTSP